VAVQGALTAAGDGARGSANARGGQSEYDRNPDNYTLSVALSDLSAVLIALEIAPAIFIGTSYGGLLTMFAGEQHGFRKADNIQRCLDAELYFYAVNVFDIDLTF
jgi:hypothetical protein